MRFFLAILFLMSSFLNVSGQELAIVVDGVKRCEIQLSRLDSVSQEVASFLARHNGSSVGFPFDTVEVFVLPKPVYTVSSVKADSLTDLSFSKDSASGVTLSVCVPDSYGRAKIDAPDITFVRDLHDAVTDYYVEDNIALQSKVSVVLANPKCKSVRMVYSSGFLYGGDA